MDTESAPISIRKIKIEGLFGSLNHEILIPEPGDYVLVHGPNGVGKTKTLTIIYLLVSLRLSALNAQPFKEAVLEFSDGSVLTYCNEGYQEQGVSEDSDDKVEARICLSRPGELNAQWLMRNSSERETFREIQLQAPVSRVPIGKWRDLDYGDIIDRAQLIERYESLVWGSVEESPESAPGFRKIRDFLATFAIKIVDTQRLQGQHYKYDDERRRQTAKEALRIDEISEKISSEISNVLGDSARTGSSLDRTFPERLLTDSNSEAPSETEVRVRYSDQQGLRSRLDLLGILEEESNFVLPERTIKDWELVVMDTYLRDSEKKLAVFDKLLAKIETFHKLVARKFKGKVISLSRAEGISVTSTTGGEISLSELSSGEQHQLVLLFELIFTDQHNRIVLIDEPEISLHVEWQLQFIEEIEEIRKISSQQFIVATHSPQIINGRWSKTAQLSGYGG